MRAARLSDLNDLAVVDLPTPSAGPGELLLEVGANTLCGTDVRILRGEKTSNVVLPVVLGHELSGTIVEVGAGVEGHAVGTQVALMPGVPCRRCWECTHERENACAHLRIVGYEIDGGLAEYVLVPAASVEAGCVFPVDEPVAPERLALAEPLACVVTGQRLSPIAVGDTVLIMGAGPIGLLHLQLALAKGARAVIVSESGAARQETARRFGATVTVDPQTEDLAAVVEEVTRGIGVDTTIIAAGVPALVDEALSLARTGGSVNVFAGLAGAGWAELRANLVHYREVSIVGSSNTRRRDYRVAVDLITSGKVDTASLVTHRFGIEDVGRAVEAVIAREGLKVAVVP
ncbi:MAG: alcohol dehydrogenase catalytic domain-containing protein [Actinomycetota bacterium]